jgi:hypothetical protein
LSKHWKSVENRKSHAHSAPFPEIPRGHFRGFSDFQLRIGGNFGKGVFRFGKIFTFLRLPAGGRRPIFTWGENLNRFDFRFWVRFCAAFTRENPSGRKWRRLQITL